MSEPTTYTCPECGLHYADKEIARQCEQFCHHHQACSIEITKQSIEAQAAQ